MSAQRTAQRAPQRASQRFARNAFGSAALSALLLPLIGAGAIAGRDLDALARYPLWLAGQDFDHGTGHGVGAFLSVHEGPQRLSRLGEAPLRPGMILSNEPGYYRDGAFGIRLENLVVVRAAQAIAGADDRAMLAFETLTLAPLDRRLIMTDTLSQSERAWLDQYQANVLNHL
jgi:Xaa-Pro aminopeptidase